MILSLLSLFEHLTISSSFCSTQMNSKSFGSNWIQSPLIASSFCLRYIWWIVYSFSLLSIWWWYINRKYVRWCRSFHVLVSRCINSTGHFTCPHVSRHSRDESTTSSLESCLSVTPDHASAEEWFHIKAPRKTWPFFLDFCPKKLIVFDILVIKTFFFTKFWLFLTTIRIFFIDFSIFEGFKNEILNIMFYYSFSSQKYYTFCHRSKSL